MNYLELAKMIEPDLIKHRRWLHQHPEINQNCKETFAYIEKELTALNIPYKVLKNAGIMADIGNGEGKTILLRADMDALPMKEESGLPFASENDYAHTCGHDFHTASLLGAARLLKQTEAELKGKVRLMFQADEEGLTGAKDMIEQGVLEGVDVAFGMHVSPGKFEAGTLQYTSGYSMASSNLFKITFIGHGCHGSAPFMGIDPINVACHAHLALQTLIAREVNIQHPAVITIGKINGGDAANILPERCEMLGTLRTFNKDQQAMLKKRIEEICMDTAKAFRAQCHVEFLHETLPLFNNAELTSKFIDYCSSFAQLQPNPPVMGSEDFAYVLDQVPGVFFRLGAGGKDPMYHEGSIHHPKVRFNEDALIYGATTYATIAQCWLKDNQ